MKTTLEKYNKLRDMKLIQPANYDINQRIDMILHEVQMQMMRIEQDALKIYDVEKKSEKSSENTQSF